MPYRSKAAQHAALGILPLLSAEMTAPSLVRWVEQMASERQWSDHKLAHELDLTPASWAHIRAGRDAVSLDLLIRLGEVFGPTPSVQRALAEYVLLDARRQHPRARRRRASAGDPLPYAIRWRLRRWIARRTAETNAPQRGLYIESADPRLLTAAIHTITVEAATARLHVALVRADERLSASHAAALLGSDILVVERIEFASAAVQRLLHERSDRLAPFVVTSTRPRDAHADAHLVRLFRTWTHLIRIPTRPPGRSTPNHHHA